MKNKELIDPFEEEDWEEEDNKCNHKLIMNWSIEYNDEKKEVFRFYEKCLNCEYMEEI